MGTAKARIGSLDGVRGIAILMVLAVHLELFQAVPFSRPVRALFWAGWSGVDLFFVLSGFLITGILLDEFGAPGYFSRFYQRRARRIFPLYYLVCVALMIATPYLPGAEWKTVYPTWKGWISYGLFLQNWWMPHFENTHRLIGHLWSLGVEEQFYLVWPACVFLLRRDRLKWLCGGAFIGCLVLRFMVEARHPGFSLMNTATRIDTLLLGAFCAIAVRDEALSRRVRRWLPTTAAASFLAILVIDFGAREIWSRAFWTSTIGFSCFALFYGAVVLWAYWHNGTGSALDRVLQQRWLRQFGKYSYGLYVYHLPIFYAGGMLGGTRFGVLYCVALIGVSYAVAKISYECFEKRLLAGRRDNRTFREPLPQGAWTTNTARLPDWGSHTGARLDETEFAESQTYRR